MGKFPSVPPMGGSPFGGSESPAEEAAESSAPKKKSPFLARIGKPPAAAGRKMSKPKGGRPMIGKR